MQLLTWLLLHQHQLTRKSTCNVSEIHQIEYVLLLQKQRGLCLPVPAATCLPVPVCLPNPVCSCLYLPIPPIPNTGASFASEGAGYSPHQIHTCQAGKGAILFRWHHLLLVAVCTSCLGFSCWCRTPLEPPSTDQRFFCDKTFIAFSFEKSSVSQW